MMTRYEARLDGKSLSALDPSIYIRDIAYGAPKYTQTETDVPGRDGQRVSGRHAQSTSVTISFEIHEQDTRRRREVCRRVQEWAMRGGALTTRDRPGQRLCVTCDSPPVISSALKWTQTLKMTFTARAQPFWEDEWPRSATLSGASASGSLYAPGFGAQTRVEAVVKNTSGETLNALTLGAGGTTFDFTELALASGETLTIDYDEEGLLRIRAGDASKMSCRTADSDDDLRLETGKTSELTVTAEASVSATFKARGLYL